MAAVLPALLALHQKNNRASAENWGDFTDHRRHVTSLVLEAPGETVAILGAGNCNDLDLAALAGQFREVHLFDLDEEAVQRARNRQPPEVQRALVIHAPVELSGALARLASFKNKAPTPQQLASLPGTSVDNVIAAIPGTFDVVVSSCFLSQLMHSCFLSLGVRNPHLEILACALAVAHVRTMVRLLKPGGTGVIVTDTVSSETYPLDELWGEQAPTDLLHHLEQTDNVLSGTAPSFIGSILLEDPAVAPLLESPQIVDPWLWTFSSELTFLAYAVVIQRRA